MQLDVLNDLAKAKRRWTEKNNCSPVRINEIAEQAKTIYEVIMDCFYSSKDDGVKQSTIDSAMFAHERLQNLDPTFVVDFSALEIENFNTGILADFFPSTPSWLSPGRLPHCMTLHEQ